MVYRFFFLLEMLFIFFSVSFAFRFLCLFAHFSMKFKLFHSLYFFVNDDEIDFLVESHQLYNLLFADFVGNFFGEFSLLMIHFAQTLLDISIYSRVFFENFIDYF